MTTNFDIEKLKILEASFRKNVAGVQALREAMIPHQARYTALVAKAATGGGVGGEGWAEVETKMAEIARQAMRYLQVMKFQQEEIAEISVELAAKAATEITAAFCFLPTAGNA